MTIWTGDERGDDRRRERILDAAGGENPFSKIINKFYNQEITEQTLDELSLAIEDEPRFKDFKETLDRERPAYTSIFRYDPSSIRFLGQEGCFSSRISMGASVGYGRIFEGLRSDNIFTLRTSDEVMVVIQRPSYFIDGATYAKPHNTDDPTVLFTSKMFQHDYWLNGRNETEEHQVGMVVKHSDRVLDVFPDDRLVSNAVVDGYIKYAIEQIKRAKVEAV